LAQEKLIFTSEHYVYVEDELGCIELSKEWKSIDQIPKLDFENDSCLFVQHGKKKAKSEKQDIFCERCKCNFSNYDEHIKSKSHIEFGENNENWVKLDKLIADLGVWDGTINEEEKTKSPKKERKKHTKISGIQCEICKEMFNEIVQRKKLDTLQIDDLKLELEVQSKRLELLVAQIKQLCIRDKKIPTDYHQKLLNKVTVVKSYINSLIQE